MTAWTLHIDCFLCQKQTLCVSLNNICAVGIIDEEAEVRKSYVTCPKSHASGQESLELVHISTFWVEMVITILITFDLRVDQLYGFFPWSLEDPTIGFYLYLIDSMTEKADRQLW